MKRILIVQETLVGGGAERVLIDILNKFDYSKYDVELLLLRNQGIYLNDINKNVKIKYIFGDFNKKNGLNKIVSWKLYNLLCRFFTKGLVKKYMNDEYDVIIGFLEGFSSLFVSKYDKCRAKKIAWVHNDLRKLKTITFNIDNKVYNNVDEVVCVSEDSKKALIELYPEIEDKVRVIYNLIDVNAVRIKAKESIDDFNSNVFTLIGVGRLSIQKRFDIMIKAQKLLKDQGVETKLIILGEGTEEKNIRSLINNLNLQNDISILGFKSNPYKYISNADVFVMSSDFEGLPVVICEALVLGKPIVATNCTGPAELLDYGRYGVICECGEPKQLAEAIKQLVKDREKLKYYSKMSLKRSEIFNEKEVLKKIYDLIDE